MNDSYLTNLPIDLFIYQLSYLHFDDVINICQLNTKFYSYGSDSKYNNKWKQLIDNTYSNIYNYEYYLNKIWSKLRLHHNRYNYRVYTKLINILDPITQLMIYYQQNDIKSFNLIKDDDSNHDVKNERNNDEQKFLALFLLNKPLEMMKYDKDYPYGSTYVDLLRGYNVSTNHINEMFIDMVSNNNIKGAEMFIRKGANIHVWDDYALRYASRNKNIEMVKYLVENGANIHARNDYALRIAESGGFSDIF